MRGVSDGSGPVEPDWDDLNQKSKSNLQFDLTPREKCSISSTASSTPGASHFALKKPQCHETPNPRPLTRFKNPAFSLPILNQVDVRREAAAYERLAAGSPKFEEREYYLHQALFAYESLEARDDALRVLKTQRKLYEAQGQKLQAKSVELEIDLLEGRFRKVIASSLELKKNISKSDILNPDEKKQAMSELGSNLSVAYLGLAEGARKNSEHRQAADYYEKALWASPSPILAQQVLSYFQFSGASDLKGLDADIRELEASITALATGHEELPVNDSKLAQGFTDGSPWKKNIPVRDVQNQNIFLESQRQIMKTLVEKRIRIESKIKAISEIAYSSMDASNQKELLATAYAQAGDPDRAARLYRELLQPGLVHEDKSLRQRVTTSLAALSLDPSLSYQARQKPDQREALELLNTIYYAELHDPKKGQSLATPAAMENRLLAARIALASNQPGEAEAILRRLLLCEAEIGRHDSRQIYLNVARFNRAGLLKSDTQTPRRQIFYQLHEQILTSAWADENLKAASLWEISLGLLQDGDSQNHLLKRQSLERDFPQSAAAKLSRQFTGLRNSQGQLDLSLKAKSWFEAEAVFVDRAVRGMGNETLVLIGVGMVIAATGGVALVYGIAGGLLTGGGYQGIKHAPEIKAAYHFGFSNVDSKKNFWNHFALSSQFLLMVPAGWTSALIEKVTERGLSRLALLSAQRLQNFSLSEFEIQSLTLIGKGVYTAVPVLAGTTSSTLVYQAQRSLLFQEGFHWTPQDVLRLCFFRSMAAQLKRDLQIEKRLEGSRLSSPDIKILAWAGPNLGAVAIHRGIQAFHSASTEGDSMFQEMAQMGGNALGRVSFGKWQPTALKLAAAKLDLATQLDLARARALMEQGPKAGGGSGGLAFASGNSRGGVPQETKTWLNPVKTAEDLNLLQNQAKKKNEGSKEKNTDRMKVSFTLKDGNKTIYYIDGKGKLHENESGPAKRGIFNIHDEDFKRSLNPAEKATELHRAISISGKLNKDALYSEFRKPQRQPDPSVKIAIKQPELAPKEPDPKPKKEPLPTREQQRQQAKTNKAERKRLKSEKEKEKRLNKENEKKQKAEEKKLNAETQKRESEKIKTLREAEIIDRRTAAIAADQANQATKRNQDLLVADTKAKIISRPELLGKSFIEIAKILEVSMTVVVSAVKKMNARESEDYWKKVLESPDIRGYSVKEIADKKDLKFSSTCNTKRKLYQVSLTSQATEILEGYLKINPISANATSEKISEVAAALRWDKNRTHKLVTQLQTSGNCQTCFIQTPTLIPVEDKPKRSNEYSFHKLGANDTHKELIDLLISQEYLGKHPAQIAKTSDPRISHKADRLTTIIVSELPQDLAQKYWQATLKSPAYYGKSPDELRLQYSGGTNKHWLIVITGRRRDLGIQWQEEALAIYRSHPQFSKFSTMSKTGLQNALQWPQDKIDQIAKLHAQSKETSE